MHNVSHRSAELRDKEPRAASIRRCCGVAPTSTSMMVPQPIMTSPSYLRAGDKRISGKGEERRLGYNHWEVEKNQGRS